MKNRYEISGDTTRIHTNKGFILIDTEDLEKVSNVAKGRTWDIFYGYARCGNILMHRVVMDTPKGLVPDHFNFMKVDNRKCNLENVTPSENSRRRPPTQKKQRKKISVRVDTKLSDVMNKNKVSATKLAEHLGKSRQTVSKIKNGHVSTSIETWKKIAEYLEVDINEII